MKPSKVTEVERLRADYTRHDKALKEAWGRLSAAITRSAPVQVGNVVATPGDREDANTEGTYQIAAVYAVDWDDVPRYRVRKSTSNGGWHATVMQVPGLSSDINKGRYKLVEEAS